MLRLSGRPDGFCRKLSRLFKFLDQGDQQQSVILYPLLRRSKQAENESKFATFLLWKNQPCDVGRGVGPIDWVLHFGVQVDDSSGNGIIRHFVAVVNQDEEQIESEISGRSFRSLLMPIKVYVHQILLES